MIANYHTHTWRCNHADPDERAYIEAAVAGGIKILGFSDHTPYPGMPSWFRMSVEQAPEYFAAIRRLRDEYAGQIELHVGVEAEYYPLYFKDLLSLLRDNGCEYMLLGQHYVRNEEAGTHYNGEPTGDDGQLVTYADEVVEAIYTGYFTYVAHPDLIHYVGENETLYLQQMRRICRAAAGADLPLELNLLGLRDGRNYPDRRFWQIAAEEGNRTVLGCDAHHAPRLNDPETEAAGRQFLADFGLTPETTVPLVPLQ